MYMERMVVCLLRLWCVCMCIETSVCMYVERREVCGGRDVSVCFCVCRETVGVWRETQCRVSVCVGSWMCVGFKGETGCLCGWRDCFLCVYGEMGVWVERDRFTCVSVCIEMGVCVEGATGDVRREKRESMLNGQEWGEKRAL